MSTAENQTHKGHAVFTQRRNDWLFALQLFFKLAPTCTSYQYTTLYIHVTCSLEFLKEKLRNLWDCIAGIGLKNDRIGFNIIKPLSLRSSIQNILTGNCAIE